MEKFDEQILDLFENADFNSSLLNENIDRSIQKLLLDYQILHVQNLVSCIKKNNIVLDTSDTGCGKTYCALATCKQLNLQPIIFCPKTIISNWKKIAKIFKVKPLFVCNYETIRNSKYYVNQKRKKCPYIRYIKSKKYYIWKNINKNHIFIFDEVHFCRNKSTLNGRLLASVKKYKSMLLSATLIDDLKSFQIFTYLLDWCKDIRKTKSYLSAETTNFTNAKYICEKLYPTYASRIAISDLGDKFPSNSISVDSYDDENVELINEEYNKLKNYYKQLDRRIEDRKRSLLSDITFSRQKIELYKLGILVDLTKQYLENKYSVVIFVNFSKSIELLSNLLKTKCIVWGRQTLEERELHIRHFQKNKEKVIICNIRAGGQSINLHDIHGGHPRVSLIIPSYSSTQLIQALGRIHRAGSKTPATQKIIFCSGTIEDHINERLEKKMKYLKEINDNDLSFMKKK
jgi:superfamily II DNA or RNA helicase